MSLSNPNKRTTWMRFASGFLAFFLLSTIIDVHVNLSNDITNVDNFSIEIEAKRTAKIDVPRAEPSRFHPDSNIPYRKWAYVYLVGGCNRKKSDHTGFIANIAVSAKQLLRHNSTADVVVLIQMSHDAEDETLSYNETKILATLSNIRMKYIPRFSSETHENFYTLMMEKFRVLDLTEYSRVLFLDSDVMPYRSLDYLFDLSEPEQKRGEPEIPGNLMENIIFEKRNEPSHGGIFMLKPNHDDYLRAVAIITETEKRSLVLDYPHWDDVLGYGQMMLDEWGRGGNQPPRTNWTWHGSFADQGFLYHWVKYEKKSFSTIVNLWHNAVVNYSPVDGKAQNTSIISNDGKQGVFNKYSNRYSDKRRRYAPNCDIEHFVGDKKPWQLGRSPSGWRKNMREATKLWYSILDELEKSTNVTLKFTLGKKTPLGGYPDFNTRINHIRLKAANNWTMYA